MQTKLLWNFIWASFNLYINDFQFYNFRMLFNTLMFCKLLYVRNSNNGYIHLVNLIVKDPKCKKRIFYFRLKFCFADVMEKCQLICKPWETSYINHTNNIAKVGAHHWISHATYWNNKHKRTTNVVNKQSHSGQSSCKKIEKRKSKLASLYWVISCNSVFNIQ